MLILFQSKPKQNTDVSLEQDDSDFDELDGEEYNSDDIASDIGENEPGMVPTRGPNCQV